MLRPPALTHLPQGEVGHGVDWWDPTLCYMWSCSEDRGLTRLSKFFGSHQPTMQFVPEMMESSREPKSLRDACVAKQGTQGICTVFLLHRGFIAKRKKKEAGLCRGYVTASLVGYTGPNDS